MVLNLTLANGTDVFAKRIRFEAGTSSTSRKVHLIRHIDQVPTLTVVLNAKKMDRRDRVADSLDFFFHASLIGTASKTLLQ